MNRRAFLAVVAGGFAGEPLAAGAQQPPKIPRIGFLGPTSASGMASRLEGLRAGLRDLGYEEGKNIVIEYRWAEGEYDRLPDLAAELVRLKVDVLVTAGTPGTLAAKRATTTVPIVMAASGNALAVGLVASLARPGGNVTGSTFFGPEVYGKRIELLKAALPRLTHVAVLFNPDNPTYALEFNAMEGVAKAMKVRLTPFEVRQPDEFDGVFTAMAQKRVDAVVITDDPLYNANATRVAGVAARRRLPSAGSKEFAEAGGLIGYGHNPRELYRRAAYFVDRILKGAKPGDLPVERPTRFDLVINLKTAKVLGLTIPQSLLGRADTVVQ